MCGEPPRNKELWNEVKYNIHFSISILSNNSHPEVRALVQESLGEHQTEMATMAPFHRPQGTIKTFSLTSSKSQFTQLGWYQFSQLDWYQTQMLVLPIVYFHDEATLSLGILFSIPLRNQTTNP